MIKIILKNKDLLMPYSKEHKEKTKNSILFSARKLFSAKGFDAVTVNEVMNDCGLTRGGFYAHFKSKAELYREALAFSAANSELAKLKPKEVAAKVWLGKLLDVYLSIEHVRGERPCPLAFLTTDILARDETTKGTYTNAYKEMNRVIMSYAKTAERLTEQEVIAVSSMIIGAVAVSRAIDDQCLVNSILSSCRNQAGLILKGV